MSVGPQRCEQAERRSQPRSQNPGTWEVERARQAPGGWASVLGRDRREGAEKHGLGTQCPWLARGLAVGSGGRGEAERRPAPGAPRPWRFKNGSGSAVRSEHREGPCRGRDDQERLEVSLRAHRRPQGQCTRPGHLGLPLGTPREPPSFTSLWGASGQCCLEPSRNADFWAPPWTQSSRGSGWLAAWAFGAFRSCQFLVKAYLPRPRQTH